MILKSCAIMLVLTSSNNTDSFICYEILIYNSWIHHLTNTIEPFQGNNTKNHRSDLALLFIAIKVVRIIFLISK